MRPNIISVHLPQMKWDPGHGIDFGQKKIQVEERGKIGESKSRGGWEEGGLLRHHTRWPRVLEKEKKRPSSGNEGAELAGGSLGRGKWA